MTRKQDDRPQRDRGQRQHCAGTEISADIKRFVTFVHRGRSLSARRKLKCSLAGIDTGLSDDPSASSWGRGGFVRLCESLPSITGTGEPQQCASFSAAASLMILALLLSGCSWSVRETRHVHGVDYCYDGQPVRLIAHYDHTALPVDWTCDPARWTR